MTMYTIKLTAIQDVKDFANAMIQFPFATHIKSEAYTVDAKSLMGIFSLNLSQPVILMAATDNCSNEELKNFENSISKYIVSNN